MGRTDDELAIVDKTGGPAMIIPLLLLSEFCLVAMFVAGLRGNISDAPFFSVTWWAIEIFSGALAAANTVLLAAATVSAFKTFGQPAYLRINSQGIWLPYEERPMAWDGLQGYFVKESPWMKGGAMQFLYVTRKKRKLFQRDIMILGRKISDGQDISSCMAWLDRFLPS